jgi:hypothetical protein
MRRVGALPAPFADQSAFPASFQGGVEELLFGLAVDQAGAVLAEHGVVKAGIGQFQAQGVLPVDSTTDGISGLAIGESLDVLEDGGQSEPCGRGGGLAAFCPLLSQVGIPAVVAMQGGVPILMVHKFLRTFLTQIQRHCLVDRAMSAARAVIRKDYPEHYWKPTLYLRLPRCDIP